MEQFQQTKDALKRLSKVKGKLIGVIKNKNNPFTKSRYADINAFLDGIEPLLEESGFMLLQPIIDGKITTEILDLETGIIVAKSELVLPEINDPQKVGSAITYYRRYTLQSLLAVKALDDDGNMGREKKTYKANKQTSKGKSSMTEEQFKKLKIPENQKLIPEFLSKLEVRDDWDKELTEIYKKYEGRN